MTKMGGLRIWVAVTMTTILAVGLILIGRCDAQDSAWDFVTAHNKARAEVGVGPMWWDESVAAYARNYANTRRGDCALIHSQGKFGENIAMSTGDFSGTSAVAMWVSEKSIYDYNSNTCLGGNQWACLHYTQVVWRDSTRLGCAKVRCSSGGTFIICSYDPPGNYEGRRPFKMLAGGVSSA